MEQAEVFRYLVSKKEIPEQVMLGHDFDFKTVFHKSGYSYRFCMCAFEHEFFSYISDTGDVDMEVFDKLTNAIKTGHCPHTVNVTDGDYVKETRINSIHVAAALGLEDMTVVLVSGLSWSNFQVLGLETEIFKLHPYEIAILREHENIFHRVKYGQPPENPLETPCRTLADMFLYPVKYENNILQVENVTLLEICIRKGAIALVKVLLDTLKFDCRTHKNSQGICELLFKYNLTDMLDDIFNAVDVFCIFELAFIYRKYNSLEKSSKSLGFKSESLELYDLNILLRICHNLQKRNIGQSEYTRRPLSEKAKLECFLYLLGKYTRSAEPIKHTMIQLSNIRKYINVPFCSGLTPIQHYMCRRQKVGVTVIKALIDLGADIDTMIPLVTVCASVFKGKPLQTSVLMNEGASKTGFREVLELLMYENVSLEMNRSAIADYVKFLNQFMNPDHVQDRMYTAYRSILGLTDTATSSAPIIEPGTYIMNATLQESALNYKLSLLIEAGFEYSLSDIHDALKLFDQSMEAETQQQQSEFETWKRDVLEKAFLNNCEKEYLQSCLTKPRSLMLLCRDILRKHFHRRQIHKYVSIVNIPKAIKDFLLLTPVLKSLPTSILEVE